MIGIHQRAGDLAVNACKKKAATNIRRSALAWNCSTLWFVDWHLDHGCCLISFPCADSATKDATTVLSAPIQMGLDDSLEYLAEDELVEVLGSPQCCLPSDLPRASFLRT